MKVLPWILSLTVSAALAGSPREHVVDCTPVPQCGDPSAFGDTFAWQHLGPVDFLRLLELIVKSDHSTNRSPRYTVHGTHRGWIQASDIPELLTGVSGIAVRASRNLPVFSELHCPPV